MSFSPTFPDNETMADLTAKMLVEVQAVHFNAETPFKFTSGWASPVYIDCRKLISYPRLRHTLMDFAVSKILTNVGFESLDAVAGGETAGIPFAAWIADRLMLPMQYVRKKPKGFGRDARIEGNLVEGARTLLVEDLATDGRSKISFCDALREAGAEVGHTFVVFYYDIFKGSTDTLAQAGVQMHWLATWWDVLRVSKQNAYFDAGTLAEVESFLNDPVSWSGAHGGITEMPS
ncbi:MAG: orotate phosphoribosyltransferase [Hyphomicrobiales bacterium]|nr:orotate phosphoribosyltransferase [Hyphomicrobiales bacterium]MCP5373892.1 orotate phosphoribosyltransferase [Hyphomicrobiales bacterium]